MGVCPRWGNFERIFLEKNNQVGNFIPFSLNAWKYFPMFTWISGALRIAYGSLQLPEAEGQQIPLKITES